MCSLLSVFATSAAALRLPPSMPVYSQPLGVMRESIAYLKDPDAFVAKRAETLGPVFLAGMFFRPTVFVGGPEAVDASQSRRSRKPLRSCTQGTGV